MVLGVLLGIAFVCVVAARLLDSGDEHQEPQAQARLEERIKPVANVVTDPSVLVKLAAAEQASRPAMTGEQVYSRSEEHTSELQSLMRISYAVFCLKKKKKKQQI